MDKKKIIIIVSVVIIVGLLITLVFILRQKKSQISPNNKSSSQTFQEQIKPQKVTQSLHKLVDIYFGYDNGKVSVIKKTFRDGNVLSTSFPLAPNELFIIDANRKILYDTKFVLVQPVSVDGPITISSSEAVKQPVVAPTVLSVPYYPTAVDAIVSENNQRILEFTPNP